MPKRRIQWYPRRGIDKTLPKHGETLDARQTGEFVSHALDASNISMYNDQEVTTRRSTKKVCNTDYGTIYGINVYNRGVAVAGSSGIYLDKTLKKSQTLSSVTSMVPWYESLYWSDGTNWGYIDDDDTAYDMGIDAPTSLGEAQFVDIYTQQGTNGSWDNATKTLTSAAAGFTSALTGEHIQVYDCTDSTCFTGTVTFVSATELTVALHPDETNPATDAGANISFYISPHRWMTYNAYTLSNKYKVDGATYPTYVKYKMRFKRSGDGARSNTTTMGSLLTGGVYKDAHWVNTLVGGKRVASIDSASDDSNVTHVEIFRLDLSVTTSSIYRLVGTVAIGTTTFDDEEEMLTSLTALDDDNKYPCPYTLNNLAFYSNRLWGTYTNRVYYSEAYITEPRFGYFGPIGENYFEFPDTVQQIIMDQRRILVFLERETWVLEGLDPDSMTKRILNLDIGTYSSTACTMFGGIVYTISSDYKFYAIDGSRWVEIPQVTSVLSSPSSYWELKGSDNAIWISDASETHKWDISNKNLWTYDLGGRLGAGSHTTYLGSSGYLYQLEETNGAETTPVQYLESPEIYIGDSSGRRGLVNRIFFRADAPSATVSVYVDGSLWKTMSVATTGEENVLLHFWPARGYYTKVRIDIPLYKEFTMTSRLIINPW